MPERQLGRARQRLAFFLPGDSHTTGSARRWQAIILCLALTVLLFGASLGLNIGGALTTNYVDNLGQLVAPLLAAGACLWAAWRITTTRRAWAFLGASSFSWGMGQLVWCYYDLLHRVATPFPSLADAGYLGAVPLAAAGLLSFPSTLNRVASRVGSVLDGVLVAGSLLFVSWSTVLGPIYRAHHVGMLRELLSMAYPAGDVILISLVVVLGTHTQRSSRAGLSMVMIGIVCFSIADSSFAYLTQASNYANGNVLDTGWVAGYLLIGLGAVRAVADGRGHSLEPYPEAAESERVTMTSVLVPYALVALAGVVATVRLVQGRPLGAFLTLEGLVLIAVLSVTQIVTLIENVALNRRLHAKVEFGTNELRAREARFSALVEHSSDPITIVTGDATVLYRSPSIARLLGWDLSGSAHGDFLHTLHPDDFELWRTAVRSLLAHPADEVTAEWRLLHADGTWRTFQSVITNLIDEPAVGGLVLNSRDVTDQRALEDQLRYQAFHDPLTGLANRPLFAEHLDRAVRRRARNGSSVDVMFIDLDNFKAVNELLGRRQGDELLQQVGGRLRETFRDADVIARMGGDVFAVLFEGPPEGTDPHAAAGRLLERFTDPFDLGAESVVVTVSIGVASTTHEVETDEELLRNASLAVNAAKAQGRRSYAVYTPALHGAILQTMRIESELKRALDRDEFVLHYQPIVDLVSGRAAGVEALVRWNHPERGLVGPNEFIPVAESSGLIVPIGEWVLRQACAAVSSWELRPGGQPLRLSVNVSPRQFSDHRFLSLVHSALAESDLDASRLTLEVTESLFVDDVMGRMELLRALRSTGVQIAIDDFGTGYSSLRALRDMPVDILKVDKSFVDHVVNSPASARLVGLILQLAEDLGMRTVAEGTEDVRQVEILQAMGCRLIQGYYFSKPLPATQLLELLSHDFIVPPCVANPKPPVGAVSGARS
jgi:diguanylate cyclase (GGDEF)-like protein/PAS domain S-box-containing protein